MKGLFGLIGISCLVAVAIPSVGARQIGRSPVKASDLAGKWAGERHGIRIEIVFTGRNDAMWRVSTIKRVSSGTAHAEVQAALKWTSEKEPGHVALWFDASHGGQSKHPVVEMARLTYLTGGGGELRLTMLPTARAQSKEYYQLAQNFPLVRVHK